MNSTGLFALLSRPVVLLAALLTASCGGGGGGGASNPPPAAPAAPPPPSVGYTLSGTAFTTSASVTGEMASPTIVDIVVTDTAGAQFGFGGTYSKNGLGGVTYEKLSATTGRLRVHYLPSFMTSPGTYRDTVTVGFCTDATCATQVASSVSTLNFTYTVTGGSLPTVTMSQATVNVSMLEGEVNEPPPVVINATVSNPTPYSFGGGASGTNNGVFSATYTAQSPTAGQLTIILKRPSILTKGTYTDVLQMRLCLDLDCLHPVAVTPSTITVNYTITDTIGGPNGYSVKLASQRAVDAAWSGVSGRLYLAVPALAANNPNSITEFDPVADASGTSIGLSGSPDLVALSDNEEFVYVGGSQLNEIRRFTLSPLAPSIAISLGNDPRYSTNYPLGAMDFAPQPGYSRVLGVRLANPSLSPGNSGVAIFDDTVPRPNIALSDDPLALGYLAWDPLGTRLYTNGRTLTVDANGTTVLSPLASFSMRFGYGAGRIYSDLGEVIDIATNSSLPPIALDGGWERVMVDEAGGKVYFVTRDRGMVGNHQVEAYSLTTHARLGIAKLPRYDWSVGPPKRIVRWGDDGLAIAMGTGHLILMRGPFVTL